MDEKLKSERERMQRQLAEGIGRHVPTDDLRILLAMGARAKEPVRHGLTPLHYAVYERYREAARLMIIRGGDVDAIDDIGYAPMHLAAERGKLYEER